MKRIAVLSLLLALCRLPLAGAATTAARLPGAPGCPVFPASNDWNQRVDGLPVARESARVVASIGVDDHPHADSARIPVARAEGLLVGCEAHRRPQPPVFDRHGHPKIIAAIKEQERTPPSTGSTACASSPVTATGNFPVLGSAARAGDDVAEPKRVASADGGEHLFLPAAASI
ncbi:MAG: hypothetical protein H0T13_09855 [Actinobacteria bacterium]|nr:hypothetical protein [Actinomycetota bacterium]